jgi:hypothetical protein
MFTLKYKGYIFKVEDIFGEHMRVNFLHLVTEEEFRKLETTERRRREEYAPFRGNWVEEIVSMIEYLTETL